MSAIERLEEEAMPIKRYIKAGGTRMVAPAIVSCEDAELWLGLARAVGLGLETIYGYFYAGAGTAVADRCVREGVGVIESAFYLLQEN